MTPIIDLQRRLAEIGRIRIGTQTTTSNGKTRPAKLDTFRLTSPNRERITAAAQLYGGTIKKWVAPAGPQWEVITTTDSLPVIVPPADMAFTQYYELWSGGGCQRRCDGSNETISDGDCLCDPDQRECAIHTRLSIMLRDLPGLGVWRIDTQGYYAAVELQAAVEIVNMAAGRGQMLPATLRLDQRMTKRSGQQTRRFAVPVLDIEVPPAQLLSTRQPDIIDLVTGEPAAISADASPLTPVPADTRDGPSIAEQVAAANTIKRNRRGSVALPATGLAPRTTAQLLDTQAAGADPTTDATFRAAPAHIDPAGPRDHGATLSTPTPRDPAPQPTTTYKPGGWLGGLADNVAHAAATLADLTTNEPDPPATPAQNRKMHALFRQLSITEHDDRVTLRTHILGYDPGGQGTKNEANQLIDRLENWTQDPDADNTIREILNQAALNQANAQREDGDQNTLL